LYLSEAAANGTFFSAVGSPMKREFDLLVYGSTGFTGGLVVSYLARTAPAELCWAVAGRDAAKLRALARDAAAEAASTGSLAQAPAIVVADARCSEAVDAMAQRTRVILSTAGPFRHHGTPVIAACVRQSTDYVDINGEVAWHRQMIDEHDAAARRAGVRLLMSAGFDSAPSDLGALWIAQRARDELNAPLLRCSAFVAMRGQLSGGTVLSGILSEESSEAASVASDPFALGGGQSHPSQSHPSQSDAAERCAADPRLIDPRLIDPSGARFEPLVGSWTSPFGMARINTRIVRRTIALLEERAPTDAARLFAPGFVYSECALALDETAARKAARAAAAPPALLRTLVESGKLPKPGAGPSEEERANGWFRFYLVGEVAPAAPGGAPRRIDGTVSGGDPGYGETAKMVAEAALLLVADRRAGAHTLHPGGFIHPGGFTTPAACFGSRLRRRLQSRGIRFEADASSRGRMDETDDRDMSRSDLTARRAVAGKL
tara:strand:- start:470 stop:1942 length:1473 start_codon:yes stop_codon:yes gene_type:complete